MSTLRGLLDVRTEERRTTFAAFGTLLVLTSGHTLLETARDALFLSKVPASQLPWVYLVVVVIALALARVRPVQGKGAVLGALIAGAVVTSAFWFLTDHAGGRRAVLFALYVWSGLFASWVTVQFWTMLGRVHTMTQAKRLYGFIGAGAVLGGVLGAFAARGALAFISARTILLVSAGLFVLAAAPLAAIPMGSSVSSAAPPAGSAPMTTGASLLWRTVFARRVLVLGFLATVTVTLADFLFKSRVALAYTDTHELAAKLSTFYAVTNTIALLAQILVGPWVFRTVGVQRALFVFPVLLLGAASAVLGSGGILASAVLLKGTDGALRYSIHKTSTELLLVPIPDGTRERVKPIIELLGTRGGQAVASVTILLLVAMGSSNVLVIAGLIVVLTVFWLANVVTIRSHYLDVFRETLRSGGLSGKVELPELDLAALEVLFAGLNSSRDSEVLAALELLAEQHRERLIPALILYHPSREVVLRALELFAQRNRTDFVAIADRLTEHPDREVAAAALRARMSVSPDRGLLEQLVDDDCRHLAATALVALMARGWIPRAEADERVRAAISEGSWETAVELARAIRDSAGVEPRISEATSAQFDAILIRLAEEAVTTDVRVRLEVARAMAARQNPAFLSILVGMLNRHELRSTAREAIARTPGGLEIVDAVMLQRDLARNIRVHLPRTLALFEPASAARKLMTHLVSETDGAVRFKILRALLKLRRANPRLFLEGDLLGRVIESTLDHAEELRRWGLSLRSGKDEPPRSQAAASLAAADTLQAGHHLLVDLVRDKERHTVQRLFMLFELLYSEDFDDIERGLRSADPKTRANSLELLENILRPPLRARVLALVGDAPASTPLATYEEVLIEIYKNAGSTMRTLADYRATELGLDLSSITGTVKPMSPSLSGLRLPLFDRARDLLTSEPKDLDVTSTGATRAPA